MQNAVITYFDGEKAAALLFMGLGVVGLTAATIFFQPRWGLRSFALTLAICAVLELALGVGLYLRTGPLALIVVAAISALAAKNRVGLSGVALGLLINAAVLLAFDIVAERRGAVYLAAIEAG